jgi:hypothetical protein
MAVLGLDPRINPAIFTRNELAKDALPVWGNPIGMAGSSTVISTCSTSIVKAVA